MGHSCEDEGGSELASGLTSATIRDVRPRRVNGERGARPRAEPVKRVVGCLLTALVAGAAIGVATDWLNPRFLLWCGPDWRYRPRVGWMQFDGRR